MGLFKILLQPRSLKIMKRCMACEPDFNCASIKKTIMDPQNKVALVTGGASKIGYAAACALLSQGARKVIVAESDRTKGEEAAALLRGSFGKHKAMFLPCCVKCLRQFEGVFECAEGYCGKVDILVNNAGIMNDKHWDEEIEVNVIGLLAGNLLAQKYMSKGGGVVINICGTAGLTPFPNFPVFSATKFAGVAASRCFGDKFHFNKTRIRVMGLCPGFTNTNAWSDLKNKLLNPCWNEETETCIGKLNLQSSCLVGKAVLHLVQYASSGSIWVCEDGILNEIIYPSHEKTFCHEPIHVAF